MPQRARSEEDEEELFVASDIDNASTQPEFLGPV